MTKRYDATLAGADQANNPPGTTSAQGGWKVALVEREHVGGTCINEGCTPSKKMMASAQVCCDGPTRAELRREDRTDRRRYDPRSRAETEHGGDLS